MKKLFLHIVLFLSIVLAICVGLDILYKHIIPQKIAEKAYWIWQQKPKKYDYIILGSSRAESSFNCAVFDSICNSSGINLAINGAGLAENEMVLKHFLEKNSTSILFLELDEANLSPQNHLSYPFHDYVYFPYMNDPLIDSYIQQYEKRKHYYIWKYIPFVKYAEFNAKFSLDKLINHEHIDTIIDSKGFRPFINHQSTYTFIDLEGNFLDKRYWYLADYSSPKSQYEIIDSLSVMAIHNIIQICNKNKIQLVFYCAPSHAGHFKKCKYNSLNKFDFINKMAQKEHLPFINFSYWKYNQVDSFYYDYSHPNTNGARAMTSIFSYYYKNNLQSDSTFLHFFNDHF
ncbi:MAG: hypothetical protein WCP57_06410 [Bacteroidota bacterium]